MTKSVVEYEVAFFGVMTATKLSVQNLDFSSELRSVVNQYTGIFGTKDNKMRKYIKRLRLKCSLLRSVKIHQNSHKNNYHANALTMLASIHKTKNQQLVTVTFLFEASSSKDEKVINQVEDLANLWFNPLIKYLSDEILLEDKKKVHAMVRK